MSARRFAFLAALAFTIIFIAGNVLAHSWMRAWRLDLRQYSSIRFRLARRRSSTI